jgi:DNA helicase HerA-like ATPase
VLTLDTEGHSRVNGVLLGELTGSGMVKRRAPFGEAEVVGLTAEQVVLLQASTGSSLVVGDWQLPGGDSALKLRPQGFNRHTFLCGQSGSGKTYALGVILEQLLLKTSLPMVIIDPNGDYVSLGEPRADASADLADAIRRTPIDVRGATGETRLKVTFFDLPLPVQAAILELDPIRDRAEYAAWMEVGIAEVRGDLDATVSNLMAGDEEHRAFGQRLTNLGVGAWQIWARGVVTAPPEVQPRARVLDLSEFENRSEALVAASEAVEALWANRASRQPTLLVIDEAHNICPAEPTTPLEHVLVNRLIQIAAEGRKYGLWLLLATQRPSKVHPQVVSQCDNLVLMRMNSPADLGELGRFFGFVPRGMLDASPYFSQGELLVAGGFVPVPSFGRAGQRLTVEPGTDVRVPMPD